MDKMDHEILLNQLDYLTTLWCYESMPFDSYIKIYSGYVSEIACDFAKNHLFHQFVLSDIRLRYLYDIKWSIRRSYPITSQSAMINYIRVLQDMASKVDHELTIIDDLLSSEFSHHINDAFMAYTYFSNCLDTDSTIRNRNLHHYLIKIDIERYSLKVIRKLKRKDLYISFGFVLD